MFRLAVICLCLCFVGCTFPKQSEISANVETVEIDGHEYHLFTTSTGGAISAVHSESCKACVKD